MKYDPPRIGKSVRKTNYHGGKKGLNQGRNLLSVTSCEPAVMTRKGDDKNWS